MGGPTINWRGLGVLLALAAVLGMVLWAVSRRFPAPSGYDLAWGGYALIFMAVLATQLSGVPGGWRAILRYAAIWAAILAVLLIGYNFRHLIPGVPGEPSFEGAGPPRES